MIYCKLLLLIVILGSCRYYIQATDYEVVGDGDYFILECTNPKDDLGNTKLSQIFKIDLKHRYTEDMDTVYSEGTVTVLHFLKPDVPIQLEAEFYTWVRSDWVATPFSMRRGDFCKAFNDPTEPWASIISKIPPKERVCPPVEGSVYNVVNSSNHAMLHNLPPVGVAGKYKIIIHFIQESNKICLVMNVHLYKA